MMNGLNNDPSGSIDKYNNKISYLIWYKIII